MAKGAAKEQSLGRLHNKITEVFIKVLDTYETRLDAIDALNSGELEAEMLDELFADAAMPNPAMLSAITKFLKDNDIGFDTEKLAELSDQERRLSERRKNRGNIISLTTLDIAADG